jgi:hypothetical protein
LGISEAINHAAMARVLVKVDVRRRAALLACLREQQPKREALGETSFTFGVNDALRHIAYVVLEWESFESARHFVDSPHSLYLLKEWPVEEVLEVVKLRDIDD